MLSRPKDDNQRRIVLDLSYPKGLSVNDNACKDKIDNDDFALKYPHHR